MLRHEWRAAVLERLGGGVTFAVAYVLSDHADEALTAGRAFPSVTRIAGIVRASEATVKRSIRALRGAGLLSSQQPPGKSNAYSFRPGSPMTGVTHAPRSPVIPRGVTHDLQGGHQRSPGGGHG